MADTSPSRVLTARLAGLILLAFGILVGPLMADSEASARLCRQLRAELASVGSGGGGGEQARRNARAAERQRSELAKARSIARRSGCVGMLGLGGSNCGSLSVTIERMERNLARLEAASGSTRGNRRERNRIEAALRSNDCDGRQREARATEEVRRPAVRVPNPGRIIEEIFGTGSTASVETRDDERRRLRREQERERRQDREARREAEDADRRGAPRVRRVEGGSIVSPSMERTGNLRTLCVRTCDGYFFPLSASSSRGDFRRDQQACEAMCPGTEVRLYHHEAKAEATTMVSVSGEAYTALPTAFNFKKDGFRRPEGCGCNASRMVEDARGFSVIAGKTPAELKEDMDTAAAEADAVLPMPDARPDPAADPETLANRAGGFGPAEADRLIAAAGQSNPAEDAGERRIRVVGPVFLPDPEGAIDLRGQARTDIR